MKKALTALLVLSLLFGGYLGVAHGSGGACSMLGLALGGDRGALRRIALAFLEDVQFKDFVSAANYHAPDLIDSVDIPFLLQRLFAVKPEALDIMDYDIVFAELDSSNLRARVEGANQGEVAARRDDPRARIHTLLRSRQRWRSLVHEAGRQSPAAGAGLDQTKLMRPGAAAALERPPRK